MAFKTAFAVDVKCPHTLAVDGQQYECDVQHNSERPLHGNLVAGAVWGDASVPVKYAYHDEPYREVLRRALNGTRKSVELPVQHNLEGDLNDFAVWINREYRLATYPEEYISRTMIREYVRLKNA